MEKADVLNKVISYVAHAHLWYKLRNTHTNGQLNDLLMQLINEEEEILSFYGLPYTLDCSEHLQFLALKDNFVVEDAKQLISELQDIATAFLKKPVISDVELLREAIKNKTIFENVLPATKLKLKPLPYFDYVYETKLLEGLLEPQLMLTEFETVVEHCLAAKLTELSLTRDITSEDFKQLQQYNLLFAEDFIMNYQQFKTSEMVY